MSELRTAAQQALEALEHENTMVDRGDGHWEFKHALAAAALRAALAEPDVPEVCFGNMAAAVAEPVASVTECEACFTPDVCQLRGTCDHYAAERLRVAAPPQRKPLAEPVQGPVAWMDIDSDGQRLAVRQWSDGNRDEVPLYTAPPQRKPLTDEQVMLCFDGAVTDYVDVTDAEMLDFARAIERAHGIGGSDE